MARRSAWFLASALLAVFASAAPAWAVTLVDSVAWPTSQNGAVQHGMAPDGTFWVTYREAPSATTARFDHLDAQGNDLGDGFVVNRNGWDPMAIDYYAGRVYAIQYSSSSFGHPILSWTVQPSTGNNGQAISNLNTSQRLGASASIEIGANGVGVIGSASNKVGFLDFSSTPPQNPFYPQAVYGDGINTHPNDPSPGWEGCVYNTGPPVSGESEQCGEWNGRGGDEVGQLDTPADTAVGASGVTFVLERADDRVTVLEPLRKDPVSHWGTTGSGAGGLDLPYDIVYRPATNTLLISDQRNRRISEYTPGGGWIRSFGWGVRTGAAQFEVCDTSTGGCQTTPSTHPRSYYTRLDLGPDDRLYATAPLSGTLEVFSFTDDTGTGTGTGTPGTGTGVSGTIPTDPKTVTLAAKPIKVKDGEKTTLTAELAPCAASREDRVLFQARQGDGLDNLKTKSVDADCEAKIKRKVSRKTKFQAVSIDPAGNTVAKSLTVTVKPQ